MIHVMKFFPSWIRSQSLYKFQTRYWIAQYKRGGGQLHCYIVIIHGWKNYLVVIQENQLKPAQISSNFNYLIILSQLWQSRSRIPGPKCLLAVPDDYPTYDLIQFRWKWTFLWHHWGHLYTTDLSWKFMNTFTQNKAGKCVAR